NGFKMQVTISNRSDIDLLSAVKADLLKIGVDVDIRVVEDAVYTSMQEGRAISQAGFGRFSGHLPYVFEHWNIPAGTPGGWMEMKDPKIAETSEKVLNVYMLNEPAAWPLMKEMFKYAMEQAWYIAMPSPYQYIPYQPWVKGYSGEQGTGYGEYQGQAKYIWIDVALKKSLGF
ncbi:MAG: hypothetical protein HYU83_03575, partial [Chloroflexi bacterium]|nr:hypothetical protein [Chloroflexota bacterium]